MKYNNGDDTGEKINFGLLATSQGWIMQNTTLIADPNPMKFTEKYFYNYVKDLYNSEEQYTNQITKKNETVIYKSTKYILKLYEKEIAARDKQKEEYEKNLDRAEKKTKSANDEGTKMKDSKKMTKDDISQKI